MKNFEKPVFEVVSFTSNVITSSGCGCYDEEFGVMPNDCLGDVGYCNCKVNHSPAEDNCTPCGTNQGA